MADEQSPPTELAAHHYTPLGVLFEGEPDRNMKLNWLGPLPRVGEHVVLFGRDARWKVTRIEWHMNPQLKEGRLDRAAKLILTKDK